MAYSTFLNSNLTQAAKTANVLSGDVNEFVGQDSLVNIYAVSSASGVRVSVFADSDLAIEDKEITTIGTTLNKSDHLFDSFPVSAGTRLSLFLRETNVAATTDVITGVEVLPL